MTENPRDRFDLPRDVAYFNSAYMAPLLHDVADAGRRAFDEARRPWERSAADFFEPAERVRTLGATLLGANADDIALVPSVSYAIGVAARNLRVERGQRVLVLDEQFPSNVYPWRAMASARGADVHVVARPDDDDWTRAVLDHIDDSVAVAALPHCHWTDGSRLDLVRLGAALRARGAALVLDLTQSLGALPFDVREVQPDFVACAGYKWLLGPYGVGLLYTAPHRQGGEPLEYNWITRADAEDFAGLVDYRDAYQPGARRFDMGERSHFLLLPMLEAALRRLCAWTPAAIAEAARTRTAHIAEAVVRRGARVLPEAVRAGHILGVRFPGGEGPRLMESLRAEGVFVSVRGSTMRIAVHQCIDDRDVDTLLRVLREA